MRASDGMDGPGRASVANLRVLRPVAFIGLLGTACFLVWQAGVLHYRDTGWSPVLRTDSARVQALIVGRTGGAETARAYWEAELARRVDPSRFPVPDLDGVRSLGGALDRLSGRKDFALLIGDAGSVGSRNGANARLRARPAWQQDRVIEAQLSALHRAAREAGVAPPELVLADPAILRRARQSERLYARAITEFDRWFVDPAGRSLRLSAFPGWRGRVDETVVLHAGVSPATPDPAERRLAELVRTSGPTGIDTGARILLAAHQAGLLTPGLVEEAGERELLDMARAANRLRLRLGAGPALRVSRAARSAQDFERLAALADLLGPDTLAVVELFAENAADLLDAMEAPASPGWPVIVRLALAAASGLLALLLILSAPLGAARKRAPSTGGSR